MRSGHRLFGGASLVVLVVLGMAGAGSATAEDIVKVGIARSTSNAAELMALKHGYFKEAGIKLEWSDIDSTANVIALLAQNQFQIVAGGISAGIFNALEKDLPITILSDRVSTPIGHNLMLRPELKDTVKSLKDLKGRPAFTGNSPLERLASVLSQSPDLDPLLRPENPVDLGEILSRAMARDRADRYPSAAAFMTFATDPDIVAALPHRSAALDRAALICCESGAEPVLVRA